ncbi:ribonuclease inhibitor-like [Aquarana catesbeiana]|uniref:ribonuclease inhibitor-like n=1 Tax=Aquarana catesbeiana TaxID=8400 RepID=UPI003CC9BA09
MYVGKGKNMGILNSKEAEYLVSNSTKTPVIYYTPNIHKRLEKPPGRPIISVINSVFSRLGEYLDKYLKPIVQQGKSYLRDSLQLIQELQKIKGADNWLLVTIDVNSLYTSIVQKGGLLGVEKALYENTGMKQQQINYILEGLKLAMECKYFWYNKDYFVQTKAVAMGARYAPSVANLYMNILMSNHLTDRSCPHLASVIRNNRTLKTLDLSGNNLEGRQFSYLLKALTTSQIEILLLMSNHLADNSCPHLASGIRNNQTLRTLDLSRNNLGGPHFRDQMEALTTSPIERLHLMSNQTTDSSSPHLASGIRNNRTLRPLDPSRNNLERHYFRDLMKALTTSRIEILQLSHNHLTDNSCPHLASGIRNNQTLRTLHLDGNNLEGPHFRDLMEALTTSQIEELQLSHNHLIDSSCPHLASGIRNNQTLRRLNLNENNLEGPHFRDLMEALTTSQIEELLLSHNHLIDSSCPHLASGIRNNQTLRRLNLNENNLEGPHFRDLMEALTTSRIEELLLSHNHLTDSSCSHLASGIRNNQTLRTLNLNENKLEGRHFRDLMEALTTSWINILQIGNKNLSRDAKRELKMLRKLRPGLEIYC